MAQAYEMLSKMNI